MAAPPRRRTGRPGDDVSASTTISASLAFASEEAPGAAVLPGAEDRALDQEPEPEEQVAAMQLSNAKQPLAALDAPPVKNSLAEVDAASKQVKTEMKQERDETLQGDAKNFVNEVTEDIQKQVMNEVKNVALETAKKMQHAAHDLDLGSDSSGASAFVFNNVDILPDCNYEDLLYCDAECLLDTTSDIASFNFIAPVQKMLQKTFKTIWSFEKQRFIYKHVQNSPVYLENAPGLFKWCAASLLNSLQQTKGSVAAVHLPLLPIDNPKPWPTGCVEFNACMCMCPEASKRGCFMIRPYIIQLEDTYWNVFMMWGKSSCGGWVKYPPVKSAAKQAKSLQAAVATVSAVIFCTEKSSRIDYACPCVPVGMGAARGDTCGACVTKSQVLQSRMRYSIFRLWLANKKVESNSGNTCFFSANVLHVDCKEQKAAFRLAFNEDYSVTISYSPCSFSMASSMADFCTKGVFTKFARKKRTYKLLGTFCKNYDVAKRWDKEAYVEFTKDSQLLSEAVRKTLEVPATENAMMV